MYSYNIMQWLLFFYIYCLIGWIWECLYVSVIKAEWVNRGFMHGPFLPIYGTGATIMLFLTLPVKFNIILTFFVGMIGATILEYVTGALMEKIFGVRYWDYSKCFLNFQGHICLKASILWGVFSVLLVNCIHALVEKTVISLSFNLLQVISLLATAVFSADFCSSFREALDLKELLTNLTENNEELRKLEKRIEVVTTVIGSEIKEKTTEKLVQLNRTIEDGKRRIGSRSYMRSIRLLKRNPDAVSKKYQDALMELIKLNQRRIKVTVRNHSFKKFFHK